MLTAQGEVVRLPPALSQSVHRSGFSSCHIQLAHGIACTRSEGQTFQGNRELYSLSALIGAEVAVA